MRHVEKLRAPCSVAQLAVNAAPCKFLHSELQADRQQPATLSGVRLFSTFSAFSALTLSLLLGVLCVPREAEAGWRDTRRGTSSLTKSDVTIYGATWCPACRALEAGLRARDVPFDVVDVDKSPQAFERARAAAGTGSSIPLTGVVHGSDTSWIVGADVDGVEKLFRGK